MTKTAIDEGSVDSHELCDTSDPVLRIRVHGLHSILGFCKRRCAIVAGEQRCRFVYRE